MAPGAFLTELTRLFSAILNMSAAASILGGVVLLLRTLLKNRLPRWVFHTLWLLVLVRMVLPFSIPSPLSAFNLAARPGGASGGVLQLIGAPPDAAPVTEARPGAPDRDGQGAADLPPPPARPAGREARAGYVAAAVWGAVFILLAAYALGCYGYTLSSLRGAERLDARVTGIPESIPVCRSRLFRTPVVCGLVRPRLILPAQMETAPSPALCHVMSHELTHVLRHDNLWKAASTLALYLHWFNPVLWLCYSCYITDMEASCDEKVVRNAGRDIRAEYAAALVDLASSPRGAFAGGFLSFGECALKERVRQILRPERSTAVPSLLGFAVILGLAMAFLTDPSPGSAPVPVRGPAPALEEPFSVSSGAASDETGASGASAAAPLPSAAPPAPDGTAKAPAPPDAPAAPSSPDPAETAADPPDAPARDADPAPSAAETEPVPGLEEIDYINLYPSEPLFSCVTLEDAADAAPILSLLETLSPLSGASAEGGGDLFLDLEIRRRDGTKEELACYGGGVARGGVLYGGEPLSELYALLDMALARYPMRAAWLGYMNSNRLLGADLTVAGAGSAHLSGSSSDAQYAALLDVSQKLRGLGASFTEAVRHGEEPYLDGGDARCTVRLLFEGGDSYTVTLYDNRRMTLSATGMYYDVAYQITGGFDALTGRLRQYALDFPGEDPEAVR